MTNSCVYDCQYCVNRCSNDIPRATFTPEELAQLTIEFYRRNYIEGLFLGSGVLKNPDYAMERMCRVLELLRGPYRFGGYIHAKAIPGCSPELMDKLGRLCDRMSVNIECPANAASISWRRIRRRKTSSVPWAAFGTASAPTRRNWPCIATPSPLPRQVRAPR